MKSAIKLSLIDDYITISLIDNFYNNNFSCNLIPIIEKQKSLCLSLKKIYDKIFTLLNLKDISFSILEEQLSKNNHLYFQQANETFENLEKTLSKNEMLLSNINTNLGKKLLKLKINPLPLLTSLNM